MPSVRQLFKDPELDKKLRKNGYVTMPVLNADDTRRIKEFYESIDPSTEIVTHCKEEYSQIGLNTAKDRYNSFEINVHPYGEVCNKLQNIVAERALKPFLEEIILW